jgi:hypothetical protein
MAVWVWVTGSAIARGRPAAERVVAGALAALALAWAGMLAGALHLPAFGHAWLTVAVFVAVAAAGLALRRPPLRAPRPALWPAALAAAAVAAVSLPMAHVHASDLWPGHGDMVWHIGWTRQLLAGAAAPGGIYAGAPNDYPWLYHALLAGITAALPGGVDPALVVLQAVGLAAGAAGTWLLARALGARPAAAAWSLLIVTVGGGAGWLWQHHPAAVFRLTGHGLGPYHGDLEVANAMAPGLGNVPPLLPRDVGLLLAPSVLWLAVRALNARRGWWLAGAGGGLVYLMAPLAGGFCTAWIAVLAARERTAGAWRAAVAAVAVTAAWLIPLAVEYARYGGFHSVTRLRAVNPSAGEAAVAMGVALPLGVAGLMLARGRDGARLRALAVVPAAVTLAVVLAGLGGNVLGTPALLRWLRYLPFVVLGLAVPAGLAADALVAALGRRARAAGVLAAVVLAGAVGASTALATVAVWRQPFPTPLRCEPLPVQPGDTVAVVAHEPFADYLAYQLFGETGAHLWYVDRIRVKVRYADWLDRRVPGEAARRAAQRAFARGGPAPPGVRWLVVRRSLTASRRLSPAGACTFRGARLAVLRAGRPAG